MVVVQMTHFTIGAVVPSVELPNRRLQYSPRVSGDNPTPVAASLVEPPNRWLQCPPRVSGDKPIPVAASLVEPPNRRLQYPPRVSGDKPIPVATSLVEPPNRWLKSSLQQKGIEKALLLSQWGLFFGLRRNLRSFS